MAEYIEREAAIEYLQGYKEHLITLYESMENGVSKQCCLAEICGVSEGIRQMQRSPTADVVEVVRCGDCIHRGNLQACDGRPLDWYCPNGVRKGE